ncbi:uracil-DNA glycosylase [Toxoplasma gondii RUB]|nr:uracil-DNA glycosylase [Toxoplasma gondii GT1]KAF4646346.1 uracil-DNA glycosylase [Toxoplasma gondii]KFG27836.1 uracil-DNA glycosylase [Toxoplasma gondii p89]KFG29463.1 uracil-DNA glycosylase [Toxoplasma gondii GAB2-2007-GAL-DOM2]KFG32012.1 uracil-DNA glycosylase [Toxoplasma gondii FOU]KFG59194.1 uracil-DNA glycosylase [Toxoplasma gondii RUB]KFH02526.1 uracil-DNA glycosylase [Toxoplasma gondii VAND]PIL96990.1 uracil-DNA glycosylase [Toxoplasma gondii COUG]RQX67834.1 uracil-DNA glycosylas
MDRTMDNPVLSSSCCPPCRVMSDTENKENATINMEETVLSSASCGTTEAVVDSEKQAGHRSITAGEPTIMAFDGDAVLSGKEPLDKPSGRNPCNVGRNLEATVAPTKRRAGDLLSFEEGKRRRVITGSERMSSTQKKKSIRTLTLSSFFSVKKNTSGEEPVSIAKTVAAASACQLAAGSCSGDRQLEQVSDTVKEEHKGEGAGSVDSVSLVKVPTEARLVDPEGEMKATSEAAALWRQTLGDCWFDALKEELRLPYFRDCMQFIRQERQKYRVYPPSRLVFNAFKQTPLNAVKVVVVGQDPYHQPGQAMGLAFSVPRGIPLPPSLQNIFKEIARNYPGSKLVDQHTNRISSFVHGDLTSWASQGVFLLNSLLTVRESTPMSHRDAGWERFTTKVINVINTQCEGVVFLLWGKPAQKKSAGVSRCRHRILEAGHPSPLSVRFFQGCQHFLKCNELLRSMGKAEIYFASSSC